MKVEQALILAAGRGTRMGKVGEKLPKVLWPIFEKSLLELQVLFLRKLGVENIFINVHHSKEILLDHIARNPTFQGVNILVEDELLDIGGAVHNLKRHTKTSKKLLLLNSDQFLYFNESAWEKALRLSMENDVVLFSHTVETKLGYNAINVKESRVTAIIQNDDIKQAKAQTYTGISIVNLDSIELVKGPSRFFESVADFSKKKVAHLNADDLEYWDFGTLERYWNSMFEILRKCMAEHDTDRGNFIKFLLDTEALDLSDVISAQSYRNLCRSQNVIELEHKDGNAVVRSLNWTSDDQNKVLRYGNVSDYI